MATMITDECINCGACEPECPNTAIYQGGIEYDWLGQKHPPLSNEIFYIVPEKCTECVGFYDHEACAAVCPVDCCVPNPNIPESEAVLLARAREIHPDKTFGADFPSRFKGGNGAAPAAAPAAPAVASAAPAAAAPAAPAAPQASAQVVRLGKVEKKTAPPLQGPPERSTPFRGELPLDFDEAYELLQVPAHGGRGGTAIALAVALLQPLLGALPASTKDRLEGAFQDRRIFSAAGATAMNIFVHLLVLPLVFVAFAVEALDDSFYSAAVRPWFFYGLMAGLAEAAFRLRESVIHARPLSEVKYRGAIYGPLLIPLVAPILARAGGRKGVSQEAFEGYYETAGAFDEKRERERRYGEVYSIEERPAGYLFRMELPRRIPPSGVKTELGLADEMPDYALDLSLGSTWFEVRGKVVDPRLRTIAATAPAFPPDFATRIDLKERCAGFVQRYGDKVLEVVLIKQSAAGRLPARADAA